MGFSTEWAEIISSIASHLYFLIIILQVPLFRFPCRIGSCATPIEVLTCQLILHEVVPRFVVEGLLYPGAIIRSLMEGVFDLSPDRLLNSYLSNMSIEPGTADVKQLEVVLGSYFCVAGAFLGLVRRRGRISVFGLALILWGIVTEKFTAKHCCETVSIYPEMLFTMVIAMFCLRKDVRKLIKCCKPD